MIIVKVRHGLGNQMFQIALGLIKAQENNTQVIFDLSFCPKMVSGRQMRALDDIFCSDIKEASYKELRRYTGRFLMFKYPFLHNYVANHESLFHLYNSALWKFRIKGKCTVISEPVNYWDIKQEFVDEICKLELSQDKSYYFDGFWENTKYILEYRDFLRSKFIFNLKTSKFEQITRDMKVTESVAVHIRRGDFITKSNNFIKFDLCDYEYYSKAVSICNEHITNPRYYVFSDDIEYSKELMKRMGVTDAIFLSGNKDFEDIYLIAQCKNVITSNSSFSFWGAFLNSLGGIVICPNTYYSVYESEKWRGIKYFSLPGWKEIDVFHNGQSSEES